MTRTPRADDPGVIDDAATIPLYRETIAVPRWGGVRPHWDGFCVMSRGVTGWFLGELPSRWLARRGRLHDVIHLDSAIGRLRLPTIPHNAVTLFDSWASTALPSLRQDMRAAGGRLLVSLEDDYWHIPDWVPMAEDDLEHLPADVHRVERSLSDADSVVVHTAAMADRVQRFNRTIMVIPQALPPLDELPLPRPSTHSGIRIGWAGSQSHDGDLELIAPALTQLLARYPNVTFVLAGPDFPKWAIAARSSAQIELHPGWVRLPAYYRWLSSLDLDVFITPLVDHPFNRVKPCLKPLEAAGLSIPVVASKVGSYADELTHEETALVVENTTEGWLAALTRLVEDQALRVHLSAGGRAWAATRTIDQTGPRWADLWGVA